MHPVQIGVLEVNRLPVSADERPVNPGGPVSHQLRLLRHLGLVVGQRDGRQVVYELHDDHVAELLEQVVSHVEHVRLGLAGRHRGAAMPTA